MERKIGEIFTYNGKIYQVVKSILCTHCAFKGKLCGLIGPSAGNCMPNSRSDNTSVIFKEIKDMEIKNNQLTIDIPEGMEIDLENSDLAKGIIKFRSKWITIAEIVACEYLNSSITVSTSTRKKIIAISNLMDITKYFNGDWKYKVNSGERGYMIAYDRSIKKPYYKVNIINPTSDVYYGNPVFKNEADAQYVIDNPNFKDILDAIYKN